MSSHRIEATIRSKYPGVELQSPIQGWVFLRSFEEGIRQYAELPVQTAEDDRWAGVCYFHMHQDLLAVEHFFKAISKGLEAARINLAHALGYIERGDEVLPELLRVDVSTLSLYDKALYFRVKSLHEETNGDLSTALTDAEYAWQLVQCASEFPILAPDVLSQLAVLNGRIGRANEALSYIDENIAHATGTAALHACIHRATIILMLGSVEKALASLLALEVPATPRHILPILNIHIGDAEFALGRYERAHDRYLSAIAKAQALALGYEEFLARVSLSLIYLKQNAEQQAIDELETARQLAGDKSDRLTFRFRELIVLRAFGRIDEYSYADELRTIANELSSMGLLQERGWVELHLARALWKMGNNDYVRILDELARVAGQLNNRGFIARELVLVPDFEVQVRARVDFSEERTNVLSVHSIGRTAVALDGVEFKPTTRYLCELLIYLQLRPGATPAELFGTVVPGLVPDEQDNWFRSAQTELHEWGVFVEKVDDVIVSRMRPGLQIMWDLDVFKQAGGGGLLPSHFLPSSSCFRLKDLVFRERLQTLQGRDTWHV